MQGQGEQLTPKADRLGRIAIVVALTAAALVATTSALVVFRPLRAALGVDALAAADYSVGQPSDVPVELIGDRGATVVFFLRSDCGGCQAAAPALRRLIGQLVDRTNTRLLMITGVSRLSEERNFAKELGLRPDQVVAMDLSRLRLRRVPTVLVLDSQGVVRSIVSGPISDEGLADTRRLTESIQ